MHKMAYIWGVLTIVTILLLVGAIVTSQWGSENPRYHF